MIQCKVCNKFFSTISASHLKKHGLTASQYKEQFNVETLWSEESRLKKSEQNRGENNPNFGNKWTDDQKRKLSESKKGSDAWNRGLTKDDFSDSHIAAINNGIKNREKKYQTGEMTRAPVNHSDQTKKKISQSITHYFSDVEPEVLRNRAKKAVETKKKRNYDFGASMRGKTLSPATKEKISKASKKQNQKKSRAANQRILEKAAEASLHIENINDWSLQIKCVICGNIFTRTKQYFHDCKFRHDMCDICYPKDRISSFVEKEILAFVEEICEEKVISNNRSALNGKELDIYIPSKQIAIEVNGVYWHSEILLASLEIHKHKDFMKYNLCKEQGIQLITIYDTEWVSKKDIVKSRISDILKTKSNNTVGARKTTIAEITSKQASAFFNENHLQGAGKASVRLALMHNSEIVAAMTFSKSNAARSQHGWEIDRFAIKKYHNVPGAAQKLFKHFLSEHDPDQVVSFSDNRWSMGNIYKSLGFERQHSGTPNYWYFRPNDNKLYHRYSLRKNSQDQQNLTEWENRVTQGWNRIWDCGHTKWLYKKNPA